VQIGDHYLSDSFRKGAAVLGEDLRIARNRENVWRSCFAFQREEAALGAPVLIDDATAEEGTYRKPGWLDEKLSSTNHHVYTEFRSIQSGCRAMLDEATQQGRIGVDISGTEAEHALEELDAALGRHLKGVEPASV
jgi:hypothetical protein